MTDQEREQVLKMIENGKITPEDGLKLMRTLDQSPVEDEGAAEPKEMGEPSNPEDNTDTKEKAERPGFGKDPRIEAVKSTVQRLWQIPLWIGIAITILGAWGMYTLVQASRLNFWFYCFNTPLLLLGVLVIVAAIGSRKARWLFVDVNQKPGQRPQRIFLGFPLPLKFITWLFRIVKLFFPHLLKELDEDKGGPGMEGVIKMMELVDHGFTGDQPLVVNVDDDDGERVQVYIG
jgi:hypothetical protein